MGKNDTKQPTIGIIDFEKYGGFLHLFILLAGLILIRYAMNELFQTDHRACPEF
jgi:hypothetical protein